MTRILMVCLGNICRSPLAEGLLQSKVNPLEVEVDSAGTGNYHIGEQPDKRSIEVAAKHGLDISTQKCRQLTETDFEIFDTIYVMDKSNYENTIALAKTEDQKNKVKFILQETYPDQIIEVPDPYFGAKNGFENVYEMLDEACSIIAKKLQK